MNSTNETLLFDRFLIMYNLCVFTCIIFIFVFHCTHVRMSYVLKSYLLTYLFLKALRLVAPGYKGDNKSDRKVQTTARTNSVQVRLGSGHRFEIRVNLSLTSLSSDSLHL